MNIKATFSKLRRVSLKKIIVHSLRKVRVLKYWFLSDCKRISGKPIVHIPLLINGYGTVTFGENVSIGVYGSPYFFNTYVYLEARTDSSRIIIEDNVYINNNASIICEGATIRIEREVLIGPNFSVYDSDFHEIEPKKRHSGKHIVANVWIHRNVFIGSNVTVLKGVEIGENSVIASGSIVVKSIPANVVAGGNPCKIIKEI